MELGRGISRNHSPFSQGQSYVVHEGNCFPIESAPSLQEIKEQGGTRTKLFEQKFTLPSGVKAEKVTSNYGKDGVLSITAPRDQLYKNRSSRKTDSQRLFSREYDFPRVGEYLRYSIERYRVTHHLDSYILLTSN